MKKRKWLGVVLLGLTLGTGYSRAFADDASAKPAVHQYQLEFVVKEIGDDGKPVNTRSYKIPVRADDGSASVRTGTKVPVRTGEGGGSNSFTQYQYLDIGVNIDCEAAKETSEGLQVRINADVSSLSGTQAPGLFGAPVVRQNKWGTRAVLPVGKEIHLFSSDNLDNKGRMEVDVTATQMH